MKNIVCFAAFCTLFSGGCKKDEVVPATASPTPYVVRMTDAPGNFNQVNVDVKGVEITAQGKAIMLNVNPGIYNLLNFTNGVDTLIATGSLTVDKVQQVRLILGTNNTVMVDSVLYPLTIPSGAESGLKIQVHQTLQAGVAYQVLLDFDANQSVVLNGDSSYHLKPVIRSVENALSGAISGKLSQAGVSATITAAGTPATFSSFPDSNRNFIIKGVTAGTYSVTIVPAAPHNSVSIGGVGVTTGITTTLGVISI
jgi:hypothetical protein